MTALASEDAVLAVINRHFPATHPRLLMGRGDDCCVLRTTGPLSISTDLFMEDVHFRRGYFTPEDIGWKALAVNVSDLAGGGARPVGFSLGLALPPGATLELADGLFAGMARLAAPLNLSLTGGDLSRAEKLHLCLTVFGDVTAASMLRRANCRPGDTVFLAGAAGLARVGLLALEKAGRSAIQRFPQACAAHLRPVPRTTDGLALAALQAQTGGRLALMDLSDGLARDLPRLLGDWGARLTLPPPHAELLAWDAARAEENQWLGGEDYALIGTCEPALLSALGQVVPAAIPIGTVTESGLSCNGHVMRAGSGFDHFAS